MGCGVSNLGFAHVDDSLHVMIRKSGPYQIYRPRANHPLLRHISTIGTEISDANGYAATTAADTANDNATTGAAGAIIATED